MSSVYVVCWIFLQTFQTYFYIPANSVNPDQTAPKGAVWSGSTLFAEMTFKITSRWQSRRQLLWLAVEGLRSKDTPLIWKYLVPFSLVGVEWIRGAGMRGLGYSYIILPSCFVMLTEDSSLIWIFLCCRKKKTSVSSCMKSNNYF